MARLVQQYPNSLVYLDISYFDRALLADDTDVYKAVCRMFGAVVAAQPRPVALADRLLFGTDWSMLGQEELFTSLPGRYADRIFNVLSKGFKLGDASANRVMYDNAITFLGLAPANPGKNRARLKTFYNQSGLDAGWLDEL
jgi:hypothetical protein